MVFYFVQDRGKGVSGTGYYLRGESTNLLVKPLMLRYVIAYIPSLLLAFACVWFSGLREPLAKTAYRDIWINFTGLFALLCMVNAIVCVYKQKRGKRLE